MKKELKNYKWEKNGIIETMPATNYVEVYDNIVEILNKDYPDGITIITPDNKKRNYKIIITLD